MSSQITLFSFVIITYNRKEKLCRLLNQFLDERWEPLRRRGLQIVVADDHSTDNSADHVKPTLEKLAALGFVITYRYREKNLRGDENLRVGYHEDALGTYAWLLCDDDQLDLDLAPKFIEAILKEQPAVAVCGFGQGVNNAYGSRIQEYPSGKILDPETALKILVHYTKTSTYVVRRDSEVTGRAILDRWDGTLYQWICTSILLFAKYPGHGVYLDARVIAFADADFIYLRYSYRTFATYFSVIRDILAHASLERYWPAIRARYFPRSSTR